MPHVPAGARAVFFDAVGTLLFPEPGALVVYAETARRHGLALSPGAVRERFVAAYRLEEDADAAGGWVTSETRERDRWRRIVTDTLAGVSNPEACFGHLFDHFAGPRAWRVAPDAAEVLAALSGRGLLLGLGSNYDDRLWSVLAGFPELAPVRDRVLISSAVGVRKPGAAFFHAAARAANCDVSEVLFVGDDLGNDYVGATAAGMPAVLLDPHGSYPEVPQQITRLTELL
ncbi:MAG: HAD-IA family hydrolase [Planctomycetes bacterium]|nr:HAD-IA family hydrolase [Planctomycetota bacterium]